MKLLQRLVVEEKGQGITEYALILGLVVFGIWLLVTQSGIGAAINNLFGNVKDEIVNCSGAGCGAGT